MEKINLFMFWLGDDKTPPLPKAYENFNIVFGPTDEDHNYLLNNYPYYRKSFDAKKYSFCSDVGRLGMLSKHKGLYVDGSAMLGDGVLNFINKIKGYEVAVFRGNLYGIESSVLGSGKRDNDFFKKVLSFYEKDISLATFILPLILTKYIFESGIKPGGEEEKINNISVFPLQMIRNKETIGKTSVGSGYKNSKVDYFNQLQEKDEGAGGAENFEKRIESSQATNSYQIVANGEYVDVSLLRKIYEGAPKRIRRELNKDYKMYLCRKSVGFFEKLVWSKLYVIFTLRFIKNKQ